MPRRRVDSLTTRYGKWALVAGASKGLGAAFAAQLAERGMHLVLVARRGHLLAELGERLAAKYGVRIRCLALDPADPGFAGELTDAVAGLDLGLLIYNAAYVPAGPFLDAEDDALERAVDVNVRGPLLLLRALLSGMRDRGRGAVVLMSSLSGLQGGAPRLRLRRHQGIQHHPRRGSVVRTARARRRGRGLLRRRDAHPRLREVVRPRRARHAVPG